MAQSKDQGGKTFSTKKCYECLTHIPLAATVCNVCKSKVGEVDRNGIAKKPIDWKAYLGFIVAAGLLAGFIWKVFF